MFKRIDPVERAAECIVALGECLDDLYANMQQRGSRQELEVILDTLERETWKAHVAVSLMRASRGQADNR